MQASMEALPADIATDYFMQQMFDYIQRAHDMNTLHQAYGGAKIAAILKCGAIRNDYIERLDAVNEVIDSFFKESHNRILDEMKKH